MDEQRFDQLSRRLASFRTRRQAVKAIAAAIAGTAAGARLTRAGAQACTSHYGSCAADDQCCAGSVCEYGLCMPGCRIDGAFTNAWMSPPGDICRVCTPEQSTTSWSPANEGMSCWSGDPNAGVTTCQAGACAPVAAVAASCPPPTPCQLEGSVDPVTGQCVNPPAPAGTSCGGSAMCYGEIYQPGDTCDGNGFCIGGGAQAVPCMPYKCGAGACTTSCASDDDCAPGAHCDDGHCLTDLGLGESCDEDSDCQAGLCVEGVCCNQRCDGPCETCAAETGGYCKPVVCAETGDDCTRSMCDPATGQCIVVPRPDGTRCDDGNACTDGDYCRAGLCVSGQPVTCDSANPCIVDSCDPAVGCVQQFKIAGASCDDGNPCDGNEICDGVGHCVEGTPVYCQPPDQCHEPGVCNPGTGLCDYDALPDGTLCNDGNSCTYNDTCQQGVCTGTPADLANDPENCGQCGYRCSTVGSNYCASGRCCAGAVCCPMGTRPSTCQFQCGTYPCNCYDVPYTCNCRDVAYSCGPLGSKTCYETVCDTCTYQQCSSCPQYCEHACCV